MIRKAKIPLKIALKYTETHTHSHTQIRLFNPESPWQTDNSLTHTVSLNTPSSPSTPELHLDSCASSKHFLTNTAVRLERTHLSPEKHTQITKDTGPSPCTGTVFSPDWFVPGGLKAADEREGDKEGCRNRREKEQCVGEKRKRSPSVVFFPSSTADTFVFSLYCCRAAPCWLQLGWGDTGTVRTWYF